jgi:hypothetical protein
MQALFKGVGTGSTACSVPRPSGQTQELERLRLGTSAEPVFMAVVAEGPVVCLAFHPQIGLRRGVRLKGWRDN